MEQDEKFENQLNLALDLSEEEREKSKDLDAGYDKETDQWEIIFRYAGTLDTIRWSDTTRIEPLSMGYAIAYIKEDELEAFGANEQVIYIEKPKNLLLSLQPSIAASCMLSVKNPPLSLTGRGVFVAVIDTGIDIFHPDFVDENGDTKIYALWDQTVKGSPPKPFLNGNLYTKEEINKVLHSESERYDFRSKDRSGHGTAVAGIAAGNGRASDGVNQGVACESDLLVVKMGIPRENSFPRTTELIQGIDYLVRQALTMGRPMAINLSFGNNYGSHKGDSLLETYIDMVSSTGRLAICTGTGNNGNQPLHEGGTLKQGQTRQIELSVSSREPTLNVQLWKSYEDEMSIYIENPSGNRIGPLDEKLGPQRYRLGNTDLLIYYGKPGPYHLTQEIYIDFLPGKTYVDSGDWKIILSGKKVRGGEYYLWLPGGNTLNRGTGFYEPRAYGTLTIPATARRVITVGAYDSLVDSYADFSGRGSRMLPYLKPDLVAPGVNIVAPVPGGGYRTVTGTSFAAPFVSGSAALLMQWGIVNGNDLYLYGEKVKAYLRKGARPLPGYEEYPNEEVGWGEDVIIRLH